MIKTSNSNSIYSKLLSYIPQSLILDKNPYFVETKIKTREKVLLNNKELSDTITERISPFGTHSTLISLNRSKRPQPTIKKIDNIKEKECLFDKLDSVAKPQRKEGNVYIAPNPFAFNLGYHDLIITNDHIENIEDIKEEHIEGIITILFKRAQEISQDKDVININMGINFGTDKEKFPAGASQPHLHAQIGAIFQNGFTPSFSLRRSIEQSFEKDNIDYTGEYIKAIKSSSLDIIESKNFILFAPFAPRFKDEIHILPKELNIPTLVSPTKDQINELMSLIYKVLDAFKKINISSFNIIFEGEYLDKNSDTRIMISIIPRQSDIAYSELNSRFVIDRFPEITSSIIKQWIQK